MPHPNHFPPLIELEQTDSTNNYAMQLVREGMAKEGMAVLAYHQTAGKGQRSKNWLSEQSKGLNLSIVVSADFLSPTNGFQLLATTAVAVTDVLNRSTGQEFKIKWPNDIYRDDKKAGGILIESVIQGTKWKWSVIGIGINVLQERFPADLPNAISLKQICEKDFDIKMLAESIRKRVMDDMLRLKEEGFDQLYHAYLQRLYKLGKMVELRIDNRNQTVYIKGVSKEGLLETGIENDVNYAFGDVEWVQKF